MSDAVPYPPPLPFQLPPARHEGAGTAAPMPLGAPQTAPAPPLRLKLLFWFILSAFSVFFAEVVSGSYPFPFFNPFVPVDLWGLVVLMPLYGLHTLVLASIIFAWGKPRFPAVFFAGVLFGLYEAYITKVLWSPTWGPPILSIGGIAVIEFVILSLWWHPFMSFAIPLTAAETGLTSSREVVNGFPPSIKKLFAKRGPLLFVLFAMWAGAVHGGSNIVWSLLSSLISMAFLLALIFIWRNLTGGMRYPMRALLPTKRQVAVLMVLLVLLYLVLGALLLPWRIPGIAAQVPILAFYATIILLLFAAIRNSKTVQDRSIRLAPIIRWRWLLAFAALFTTVSALFTRFSVIVLVISWIPGFVVGLMFLSLSVGETLVATAMAKASQNAGNSQS